MSLISWSEAAFMRNIRQLDPFQRARNQQTLASVAHAVRFHSAINAAIVRAALGFPANDGSVGGAL